jgi:hypothetical protein
LHSGSYYCLEYCKFVEDLYCLYFAYWFIFL